MGRSSFGHVGARLEQGGTEPGRAAAGEVAGGDGDDLGIRERVGEGALAGGRDDAVARGDDDGGRDVE